MDRLREKKRKGGNEKVVDNDRKWCVREREGDGERMKKKQKKVFFF